MNSSNKQYTRSLDRILLQRLQQEFEWICMDYGLDLFLPLLEIIDSKKTMGLWCADTRTLKFSRYLLFGFPWAVTLQVLKHEMAHMLVSKWCAASGDSRVLPHGSTFALACEILGVLPEFRGHAIDLELLESNFNSNASGKNKKFTLLEKVEKLLALGESDNEHEAELAMKKANELIARYQLDSLRAGKTASFTFVVIEQKRKQIATYQKMICSMLQKFFFVKVVLTDAFDPETGGEYKTIEIFGSPQNVSVAEYCFFFLDNQVKYLWQKNKSQFGKVTRSHQNSYYLGVIKGFIQHLDSVEQGGGEGPSVTAGRKDSSEIKALMVAEDNRLNDYLSLRFPRLRQRSTVRSRVNGSVFEKGLAAGREIRLHDGVTDQGKPTSFLTS